MNSPARAIRLASIVILSFVVACEPAPQGETCAVASEDPAAIVSSAPEIAPAEDSPDCELAGPAEPEVGLLAVAGEAVAGTLSAPIEPDLHEEPAADPLVITLPRQEVRRDFTQLPFWFTAAFDGSLRFSLWSRTTAFARAMKRKHGRAPHLTYFVNAAFYTTNPGKSDVGHAVTKNEILVRRALTQQAINEGHDIADHGMGHHDGRTWSKEQWLEEIDRFHAVMDFALFTPVPRDEGGFVFPRFEPVPTAAKGETGARCDADADCSSGSCVELTDEDKFCTQACNLKRRCPTGTACGAPMFREDTDICVPIPAFPIEHGGKVLFNAKGEPNRKNPALKPHAIVGFRAPYLAANDALYDALAERGYRYDTSQSAIPGPPYFVLPRGDGTPPPPTKRQKILEFALMLYPGALSIPMDYNYAHQGGSRQRMQGDYENAILSAYARGRVPWNVGHHFATWEDGAYLEVLEATVDMVLGGCPDAAGTQRCAGGEVISFRELAQRLE